MPLPPFWRDRLFAVGAILVALVGGVQIGTGSWILPVLCAGLLSIVVLSRIQPVPLGALFLGLALIGYIVGNRGFAQLSLSGSVPLFPAECVLAVAVTTMIVKGGFNRELPFRRDGLNTLLGLWIAIGTVRLAFDIRHYGFMAVRDYALVYYAVFFFVGQYFSRDQRVRSFLYHCLLVAGATVVVLYPFYRVFSEFFLAKLTFRGAPLIYYKGDLVATFMALTAVLYYFRFQSRKSLPALFLSLAALAEMQTTNNRASMLGLIVATALLLLGGRWKFAALQIVAGAVAAIGILFTAYLKNEPLESTPVYEFYERLASVADPFGKGVYKGDQTSFKGDNNAFRTIWWETTIDETIETNPWTGLGFGHDLAERFVRKYYPIPSDDFSARSPHNVLITVFARMGLVGTLPFLAVLSLVTRRTIRAVRRDATADPDALSLWTGSWIILTSAFFGVVLEGPMGAVVFWTILGMVCEPPSDPAPSTTAPSLTESDTAKLVTGPRAALHSRNTPS